MPQSGKQAQASAIPTATVIAALDRLLAGPQFVSSRRLQRFLRFVVNKALTGARDEICEYALGVEVFDRGQAFDPKSDSIVRVEAARLRRKLAEYYSGPGVVERLQIGLPVGAYVPEFRLIQRDDRDYPSAVSPTSKPTVAVLPLENLSDGREEEFFTDGMTDLLITELAKCPDLRVIARTSVMVFKQVHASVREIAKRLNADYVVEGTTSRSGRRVRITSQLIRAQTEEHVWAESFERPYRQVLTLQKETAQAIAVQITGRLVGRTVRRSISDKEVSKAAFEHFLRGQFEFHRFSKESLERAKSHFHQAIAADPGHAVFHCWMAAACHVLAVQGYTNPNEVISSGRAGARRALSLDDTLAEAHAMKAAYAAMDWNWPEVEASFDHALRLNPGWAHGHHMRAILCLAPLGRLDEALSGIREAIRLDPLSLANLAILGWIQCMRGEYEEAEETTRASLAISDEFSESLLVLGTALLYTGKHEEAVATLEQACRVSSSARACAFLACACSEIGDQGRARHLSSLLEGASAGGYVPDWCRALAVDSVGDRERAFELLACSEQRREPYLIFAPRVPYFQRFASDQRFDSLLSTMGVCKGDGCHT